MKEFFLANWEVIFSGIGTAIVAAVLGVWLSRRNWRKKGKAKTTQEIQTGANSQAIQAGRDFIGGDRGPKR